MHAERKGTAEEVFSSRGRVKILKTLLEEGEMNLTQLIKSTGLNYKTVIKHLNFLISIGLVEEIRIGRIKIYRPRWVNPRVRLIEELLKDLGEITS